MAKLPVVNWKKERVGEVDLPAAVFEYPFRSHLNRPNSPWASIRTDTGCL